MEKLKTKMRFDALPPGAKFNRRSMDGDFNACMKLRTCPGEWNSIYMSGNFSGGFCSVEDETEVEEIPPTPESPTDKKEEDKPEAFMERTEHGYRLEVRVETGSPSITLDAARLGASGDTLITKEFTPVMMMDVSHRNRRLAEHELFSSDLCKSVMHMLLHAYPEAPLVFRLVDHKMVTTTSVFKTSEGEEITRGENEDL